MSLFSSLTIATPPEQPTAGSYKSLLEIISLRNHLQGPAQTIPPVSSNTKPSKSACVIQELITTLPKALKSTTSILFISTTLRHRPSSTLFYPHHSGLI